MGEALLREAILSILVEQEGVRTDDMRSRGLHIRGERHRRVNRYTQCSWDWALERGGFLQSPPRLRSKFVYRSRRKFRRTECGAGWSVSMTPRGRSITRGCGQ